MFQSPSVNGDTDSGVPQAETTSDDAAQEVGEISDGGNHEIGAGRSKFGFHGRQPGRQMGQGSLYHASRYS